MDDFAGIMAIVMVFSIPLLGIWTHHRRKMLELQLKLRGENTSLSPAVVEELRQEIKSLRDTTLQYDLSFDTALQRMEQRVEGLERRVYTVQPSEKQNENAEVRIVR